MYSVTLAVATLNAALAMLYIRGQITDAQRRELEQCVDVLRRECAR